MLLALLAQQALCTEKPQWRWWKVSPLYNYQLAYHFKTILSIILLALSVLHSGRPHSDSGVSPMSAPSVILHQDSLPSITLPAQRPLHARKPYQ